MDSYQLALRYGILLHIFQAWLNVLSLNSVLAELDNLACLPMIFRLYMCAF